MKRKPLTDLQKIELERVRLLQDTLYLRHFASRNSTWELLLIIYVLEANGDYGINDYIDRLKTLRTTRLTIQNFIKDRLQEGSLIVTESNKKSRKTLALSDKLRNELEDYFAWIVDRDVRPDLSSEEAGLTNSSDPRTWTPQTWK